MYGLPGNLDLTFFVGKVLIQACFGVHDLILHFADDVTLTVTSSVACLGADGSNRHEDFRKAAPWVLAFLGRTVRSVESDEAGTLMLTFDGGRILAVYDDSKEYESYTMKYGSHVVVV